ncbi:hypothetical protein QBC38DRAFT_465030 [Podospora fimiseda]|uniref:Secreted protein n=1 Tax=Podospora fimiseda TaxID=252190 RepID=A0AAN7BYX5_9PEZI|nr:hypothetical protein QBC38DRAFT_465030 [Podospora fimiseda]
MTVWERGSITISRFSLLVSVSVFGDQHRGVWGEQYTKCYIVYVPCAARLPSGDSEWLIPRRVGGNVCDARCGVCSRCGW